MKREKKRIIESETKRRGNVYFTKEMRNQNKEKERRVETDRKTKEKKGASCFGYNKCNISLERRELVKDTVKRTKPKSTKEKRKRGENRGKERIKEKRKKKKGYCGVEWLRRNKRNISLRIIHHRNVTLRPVN